MPERNRGQKLAFRIGLVAILVIAAAVVFYSSIADSKPEQNAPRPADNAAQRQQEPVAAPQPSPLTAIQSDANRIAKALETKNARDGSQQEEQRAEDNLKAQREMAKAAQNAVIVGGIEAFITFVGVLLVGWTLYHTKRAADAAHDAVTEARRIGEAQTRAYLSCTGATYMVMGDIITIWPIFKNTGQSPARQINMEAILIAWDEAFRKRYESEGETGIAPPIPATLSDNGMLTFSNVCGPDPMAFLEKDMDFSVRGIVFWKDVFGGQDSMAFTLMREGDSKVFGEGDRRYRTGNMNALNRTPLTPEELAEDEALLAADE